MTINFNTQRFAAYFVMGYGTEVNKQKGPYVYTPAVTNANGSSGGVSLGVLQVDLTSHPTEAKQLQAAYAVWAQVNGKPLIELATLKASQNGLTEASRGNLPQTEGSFGHPHRGVSPRDLRR